MQAENKISSISEFLVCQSDSCTEAASIYHKDYFKDSHFESQGAKKSTHKSAPFDQSLHFINFEAISRLTVIVRNKMEESFRGLSTDVDMVVQTALFKSPKFK